MGKGRGYALEQYRARLEEMPEEERREAVSAKCRKAAASLKKQRAIRRIINSLLRADYEPNEYERAVLAAFGYDIEACGVPTAAVMILIRQMKLAIQGSTRSAEFIFRYGGIPDVDQEIARERLQILRDQLAAPSADAVFLERANEILSEVDSVIE